MQKKNHHIIKYAEKTIIKKQQKFEIKPTTINKRKTKTYTKINPTEKKTNRY